MKIPKALKIPKIRISTFQFRPFSKRQRMLLNWWTPGSPVRDYDGIIADGAIRSGKTMAMSLSYILWAQHEFDAQNFIMAGKTIASFKRNVFNPLVQMLLARGIPYEEHRSESFFEVTYFGHTNRFYIFGGKDESSQDLVQGITAAGAFFDEVALMPQSFVNQATGRLSVDGSKMWFNCNPDGPYHWFKQEWIDKHNEKHLLFLHFTMDDNLSLSEHIKERYRSMYSGVFYNRYILGLWVMAEGVIYDMFDPKKHTKPLAEILPKITTKTGNPAGSKYVSCDYGTQNATVFLLWERGSDAKWYCTREYYYSGRDNSRQKTDGEFADDFQKWIGDTKIKCMIVDPAAASFIAELRKRGVKVLKAKNDVLDGIRVTAGLIQFGRLCFAKQCKNTIREFGSYVWDAKAAERGEDKPVKIQDHAMDATRYFTYTIIGEKGLAQIGDKKRAGLQ